MWNVYDIKRLTTHKYLREINVSDELDYKKTNINKVKHFLKINRTNGSRKRFVYVVYRKRKSL